MPLVHHKKAGGYAEKLAGFKKIGVFCQTLYIVGFNALTEKLIGKQQIIH